MLSISNFLRFCRKGIAFRLLFINRSSMRSLAMNLKASGPKPVTPHAEISNERARKLFGKPSIRPSGEAHLLTTKRSITAVESSSLKSWPNSADVTLEQVTDDWRHVQTDGHWLPCAPFSQPTRATRTKSSKLKRIETMRRSQLSFCWLLPTHYRRNFAEGIRWKVASSCKLFWRWDLPKWRLFEMNDKTQREGYYVWDHLVKLNSLDSGIFSEKAEEDKHGWLQEMLLKYTAPDLSGYLLIRKMIWINID